MIIRKLKWPWKSKLEPESASVRSDADVGARGQTVDHEGAADFEGGPPEPEPTELDSDRHVAADGQRDHAALLLLEQFGHQFAPHLRLAGEEHVQHRRVPVALVERREATGAELLAVVPVSRFDFVADES